MIIIGQTSSQRLKRKKLSNCLLSYRQNDDRWGADHLGESRYTMESSGCIVTSIATAISASDKARNPGSLNAYLSNDQVFDAEGNLLWGRLDEVEGFQVSVYSDVANQHIEECLDEGHYPIVKIHRNTLTSYHHYIVIIGSKDGDYICMDPLQDELTHLSDYGNKVYAIRCVWVDD